MKLEETENMELPNPQTKPKTSLSQRIKQLMTEDKMVCEFGYSASSLCLSKNCKSLNPFICGNAEEDQCKCQEIHSNCEEKKIKSFMKVFANQDNFIKRITQAIYAETDQIIAKISTMADSLVQQVQAMDWLCNKKFNNDDFHKKEDNRTKRSLFKKNQNQNQPKILSSKVFNEIWNCNQRWLKDLETNEIQAQLNTLSAGIITQIDDFFNSTERYLKTIRQKIIGETNKHITNLSQKKLGHISWDIQRKSQAHQIIDLKLINKSQQEIEQVGVIIPSLNQMIGSIVKWRIQINNCKQWIAIGIFQVFDLQEEIPMWQKADFKYWMITSDGASWCHKIHENQTLFDMFEFGTGDIIAVEFNKINSLLKFVKEGTKEEFTLKIGSTIENDQENENEGKYSICVSLKSLNDELQLLAPVVTSTGIYTYKKA